MFSSAALRTLLNWELCYIKNSATLRTLLHWELCCIENSAALRTLLHWKLCCIENSAALRPLLHWELWCIKNSAALRTLMHCIYGKYVPLVLVNLKKDNSHSTLGPNIVYYTTLPKNIPKPERTFKDKEVQRFPLPPLMPPFPPKLSPTQTSKTYLILTEIITQILCIFWLMRPREREEQRDNPS